VRIFVFVISVLILSACHSSRRIKGDYTRNNSRSTNGVSATSDKARSNNGGKTTYDDQDASEDEYLDLMSGGSTSKSVVKNKDAKSVSDDSKSELHTAKTSAVAQGLIKEADKLIGVRYRYGGTSPSRGFDCSGFTSYVFNKINIDIPRTSGDQSKAGKRKKIKDANIGDLIFFGTGDRVTHVGIVVSRTRSTIEVIHSTSSSGVRKDEIFGSEYWGSRVLWAIDFESL